MDDWKMIRLPFGVNGLFSGDMLVSGRLYHINHRFVNHWELLDHLQEVSHMNFPTSFPVS